MDKRLRDKTQGAHRERTWLSDSADPAAGAVSVQESLGVFRARKVVLFFFFKALNTAPFTGTKHRGSETKGRGSTVVWLFIPP